MKPEFWPGPGAGQRAARGLANESILAMYALFGGTRPTGYALFDAPHPSRLVLTSSVFSSSEEA